MNCIECKQNDVPNLNLKIKKKQTKEMNDGEGTAIHEYKSFTLSYSTYN